MRRRVIEGASRRLDAVALAAVVDGGQVHLEDLVFRVAAVEVDRQGSLAQLALDGGGRVRPDEDLLDQLLADRAAALCQVMVRVISDRRPGDPTEIDAAVLIEGLVFDRDRRLADEGGDVVEGDDDTMIAVVADVVDQRAVPVEDQHVLLEAAGGEAVDRRQVADRLGGERRHRHQGQSEQQQRTDQDDAPDSGAAVPFAEQAEPPMKDVPRAAFAGHQARPNEPTSIPPGIMKDDSEYVGKCRALRSDSNTPERFFPSPACGGGSGWGPV